MMRLALCLLFIAPMLGSCRSSRSDAPRGTDPQPDANSISASVAALKALPPAQPDAVASAAEVDRLVAAIDSGLNQPPPEGATPNSDDPEKATTLVRTPETRRPRDAAKAKSAVGSPPRSSSDWRQLGFESREIRVPRGLDPQLASAAQRLTDRDYTYAFLILSEYLTETVQRELAQLGVQIIGRHASAYKVRVPTAPARLRQIVARSDVYWLGQSPPEQKLAAAVQTATKRYGDSLQELPLIINLFEDTARVLLERAEVWRNLRQVRYEPDIVAYTVIAPPRLVPEIARLDYVLFVELEAQTRAGHDQSSAVMEVDYIRPGGSGTRFSGSSTVLGLMDTGFMLGGAAATTHWDLNKYGCGINFTSDAAGVWNDQNGHGTHVLGTIAGTGAGDSRNRGVAIGIGNSATTRVRAAKIWNSANTGTSAWMRDAMDYLDDATSCGSPRPKVINISGGSTGASQVGTDALSRKLDGKVWSYRQAYVVCSGNSGSGGETIWSPGVAKNALAVGNVLDNGYLTVGDINTGSSRGPTGDDRMKPNVVATGTTVTSALAGTSSGYTDKQGCSMATPHVSGIAATILQHYPSFVDRPQYLRALLMATAIPHDNVVTPTDNNLGGRNTYGLGRVSAYAAHWGHANTNGWSWHGAARGISLWNWGFRDIDVPAGTDRLVVVMTWDEPAASAGASKAVMYDLDLWIDRGADCAPDSMGQCGEWASQSYDDNVEYLVIDNPAAGTYRLKIINWEAPFLYELPAALVAFVIRGDPTPAMDLQLTISDSLPRVGSIVQVVTRVTNPSYIASGVHLARTGMSSGLTQASLSVAREDGISMSFTGSSFTVGDVVQDDTRSATWRFNVTSTGVKTLTFRAWSENGGTVTRSVTLNALPALTP